MLKKLSGCILLTVLFFGIIPTVSAGEGRRIEKQELRDFIDLLGTGERLDIIKSARQIFAKGFFLPDNYEFILADYKAESDFETSDYLFMNDETLGHVVWTIEIKVKKSDGEIFDFYAGAKKEISDLN